MQTKVGVKLLKSNFILNDIYFHFFVKHCNHKIDIFFGSFVTSKSWVSKNSSNWSGHRLNSAKLFQFDEKNEKNQNLQTFAKKASITFLVFLFRLDTFCFRRKFGYFRHFRNFWVLSAGVDIMINTRAFADHCAPLYLCPCTVVAEDESAYRVILYCLQFIFWKKKNS